MKSIDTWGVVVARLQTPDLHEGHLMTVSYARERHSVVLVVLGITGTPPTPRDPLDFATRKAMLYIAFPEAVVVPLADHRSDVEWSKNLDRLIERETKGHGAVLYGSRDSFTKQYRGKYEAIIVPEVPNVSATERRELAGKKVLETMNFRAGQIYAALNRRHITYPTVDVAVVKPQTHEVLLGRKKMDGGKFRFIGGFVDSDDASLEAAAHREAWEETSAIEVDNFRYLGSATIDDWRYRGSGDAVMSSFFIADYIFGAPHAADDLDGLAWFKIGEIESVLVPEHLEFARMLIRHDAGNS